MDRETVGFTQMGGEGANWVGEAPFSRRGHVFQNLGDGTYNHSGVQAIRFALMAGTDITYKILFNDAVAMTGGQGNDGNLTADQICRELLAMGVKNVALIYDKKEEIDLSRFPADLQVGERAELDAMQEKFRHYKGVSAIVYVQTCAAEKRRRRKRGQFADPDKRVFINTDICEGCGDCGLQSNCVAIAPVETELGRKREIDQSACNKDFSCIDGFCPSFVTVEGAKLRKKATVDVQIPDLPAPELPKITGTHNAVITGVGGTGVVTIGAVMAMAAHLDGKGAGMMEMAGLAQKGGAVHIHCRLAERPEDISAIRVATGECDVLIGGDLVVSAGAKTIGLMKGGRTKAVVNAHEIVTGQFTQDRDFRLPSDALEVALKARLGRDLTMFDASELARATLGDSIFSNMMIFGAAWQMGAVPLSLAAIERAIELNGAAIDGNIRAFALGRWAYLYPKDAQALQAPKVEALPQTLEDQINFRADQLVAYQDQALAQRYRDFVARFAKLPELQAVVAKSYHKLLAYKDEYEVARLHLLTQNKAEAVFDGKLKLTYHLAPPLLARKGADGRPRKREFGRFAANLFRVLARLKFLRGTAFDPFGYTAERRMERSLIAQFESDMDEVLQILRPGTLDAATALAALPMDIRGFGVVKDDAARKAEARRKALFDVLKGVPVHQNAAE